MQKLVKGKNIVGLGVACCKFILMIMQFHPLDKTDIWGNLCS